MIVNLLNNTKEKLYEKGHFFALKKGLKIRDVASFTGSMTSNFPGKKMYQCKPLY